MKQVNVGTLTQWDVETIIFSLEALRRDWEKADRKDGIESPGVDHIRRLMEKLAMAERV